MCAKTNNLVFYFFKFLFIILLINFYYIKHALYESNIYVFGIIYFVKFNILKYETGVTKQNLLNNNLIFVFCFFSLVLETEMKILLPTKVATPYGDRLAWILPGGNILIVYLKDKDKIRHRKRWYQSKIFLRGAHVPTIIINNCIEK